MTFKNRLHWLYNPFSQYNKQVSFVQHSVGMWTSGKQAMIKKWTCRVCASAAGRRPRTACWLTAGGTLPSGTAPAGTAAWRKLPPSGSTPRTRLEEETHGYFDVENKTLWYKMTNNWTSQWYIIFTSTATDPAFYFLGLSCTSVLQTYPLERLRAGGRSALLSLWRAAAPPPGLRSTAAGTRHSRSEPRPREPPLQNETRQKLWPDWRDMWRVTLLCQSAQLTTENDPQQTWIHFTISSVLIRVNMEQTGSRYSNKPSASNMRCRACLSENRPRWMCSPCPGTQPAGGTATHTHTHTHSFNFYLQKTFFSPPWNVFVFYSVSRKEIQLQKKKTKKQSLDIF